MTLYKISQADFENFLAYLLKEKIVDEVLSGVEKKKRYVLTPEFVKTPENLTNFPLSQLFVYSYGRTDSAANTLLHSHESLSNKVAVIGHACDVRALVELEKKLQVNWDNLFLITFEDFGFLEVKSMMKFFKAQSIDDSQIAHERLTQRELILTFKDGSQKKFALGSDLNVAENCSRCVLKTHPLSDILISTYGLPENSQEFILTTQSARSEEIIAKLGWQKKTVDEKFPETYNSIKTSIISQCQEKREKDLKDWAENSDKLNLLNKCTGCGMCVTSCPVCFCTQCNLTPQVRAKKMDKINFVMTRFAHVGDSCVECGRCQSNCPVGVPLALVFQSLRDKFKTRKYDAGAKRNSPIYRLDV